MKNRTNSECTPDLPLEASLESTISSASINDAFYIEDLYQRKLYLNGEITEESVRLLMRHIIQINWEDRGIPYEERDPIRLYIYSPGGEVPSALSLVDVIGLSETPIYGYNMGESHSAAFMILLACHARFCLKNSTIVIHRGSAVFAGTIGQIESATEYHEKVLSKIRDLVITNTCISPALYDSKKNEDWFLSAEDQQLYGIAEIVSNISMMVGG